MIKNKMKFFSVILSLIFVATTLSVNAFAYDTNVNITDIVAPVDGETPTYTATVTGSDYIIFNETYAYVINGITWYDLTEDSNITESDSFVENHVYRVSVLIVPSDNGYWSLQTATINGEDAEVSEADDCYIISYTFGEMPDISPDETINITIDEPTAGEKASFSATIDNECFELANNLGGYVYDGVAWFDNTFYTNVDKDDVFSEAHNYTVSFYIVKAEGVELELLHAFVNGNKADICEEDDYYLVSYEYYIETDKEIITSISIYHISEPIAGETFDYSATLSGKGYKTKDINNTATINGISWYDATDEEYVNTSDICKNGHDYVVRLYLEPLDGYILLPETVYINGKEAGFSNEGPDIYTEACFEYVDPIIKEINITDIKIPVQGDYPDYTATTDSEKYCFESKNDSYFCDGIAWFDLTDGTYLEKDINTFVGGHTYMLEMYLVPEYGFSFDLESATLNGDIIDEVWGGTGTRVILYYTFDPCDAPTDITVNISAYSDYYSPEVELIDIETGESVNSTMAQYYSPGKYISNFSFVYPTNYIMRISMEGFVTREYNITVSSFNNSFDAIIGESGDVNLDGIFDVNDYQTIVNYALNDCVIPENTSSDDDYKKAVADICTDGTIDILDCFYSERRI